MTSIHGITAETAQGEEIPLDRFAGRALLIVNVASKCGFTPQYTALQELQETYEPRGFDVLGFPCNQFGAQEPGTNEEIAAFCSRDYGVTFPIFAKIEVNGENRHPLFDVLAQVADHKGESGDVKWNFEKWLVAPDGTPVTRYRTTLEPSHQVVVDAIEKQLPGEPPLRVVRPGSVPRPRTR